MITTCPDCGYRTDHEKHIRHALPRNAWPEAMRVATQPMPTVTLKVADGSGIHDFPLSAVTVPELTAVALAEEPPPPDLSTIKADDRIRLAPGACCHHPKEMHVADAEGFPPTCMGCPEGKDEHSWVPDPNAVAIPTPGPRTVNSKAVTCVCGFVAKSAGTLRVHLAKAKIHQKQLA